MCSAQGIQVIGLPCQQLFKYTARLFHISFYMPFAKLLPDCTSYILHDYTACISHLFPIVPIPVLTPAGLFVYNAAMYSRYLTYLFIEKSPIGIMQVILKTVLHSFCLLLHKEIHPAVVQIPFLLQNPSDFLQQCLFF